MSSVPERLTPSGGVSQVLLEQRAILENATVGILFTRNRMVVQANARAAQMWAYTADELIGLPGIDLYPSREAYEQMGQQVRPILGKGKSYSGEAQMRRKDGSLFWCRISAKAINPARPMSGTIWIMDDISEDRRVRDALEQSARELTAIFDAAMIGIVMVRERRLVRCNRRYEELFGYVPGEMLGCLTSLVAQDDAQFEYMTRHVAEQLPTGRTVSLEQCLQRKDGTRFWARISGRALDPEQSGGSSVWLIEDVTERHNVEQALRLAHEELEQRVVARTAELAAANGKLQDEIFERMRTEKRVWEMAHHDILTGLPNRALLQDRLEQALTQAARYEHRVAVMFIDLDRFKVINDTLGHVVGDELLKNVAERLKGTVRAIDTVSRIGGDEFVVVLQEVRSTEDAVLVAEKILGVLDRAIRVEGHELHVTPSIGISIHPDDGHSALQLMRNADTAMYHAKASGRNTFKFFTAQMNEEAARFFSLENRLRQAIGREELLLHYQPLVDLDAHRVCGIEALLRWNDPQHGLVSPGEFIPVAEETGLILSIGEWALHEAMRQNRRWQEQGHAMLPVSVNLSPRQFRQDTLVETVRAVLADTGQPAHLLELEITEGSLMHDVEETLSKLQELAAMGIRLAIDDFGTGYSSLGYLKRFPVHKLKVDQTFVRDICEDKEDAAIVAAIIGLAKNLGIDTLAEGVENDGQLAMLLNYGCRKFQGYYFARPLAPDETDALFHPPVLGNQESLF